MRAVRLVLSHFDISPHSNFLVATDNITVVAYINKVGVNNISVPLERDRIIVCCCDSSQHFHLWQVHTWQDECQC